MNELDGKEAAVTQSPTPGQQETLSINLPGIVEVLKSCSTLERAVFETELREVVVKWLRTKGLV